MSEMLEKILSDDNIRLAYKRVYRFDENKTTKHRRTPKDNDKGDNMEAVENSQEKRMGITKTRS